MAATTPAECDRGQETICADTPPRTTRTTTATSASAAPAGCKRCVGGLGRRRQREEKRHLGLAVEPGPQLPPEITTPTPVPTRVRLKREGTSSIFFHVSFSYDPSLPCRTLHLSTFPSLLVLQISVLLGYCMETHGERNVYGFLLWARERARAWSRYMAHRLHVRRGREGRAEERWKKEKREMAREENGDTGKRKTKENRVSLPRFSLRFPPPLLFNPITHPTLGSGPA